MIKYTLSPVSWEPEEKRLPAMGRRYLLSTESFTNDTSQFSFFNAMLPKLATSPTIIISDSKASNDSQTSASSANGENETNDRRIAEFDRELSIELLSALSHEGVEWGVISAADHVLGRAILVNRLAAMNWLGGLCLKSSSDARLVAQLLALIGRLGYEVAYPIGPTVALAALSHESARVQEAGIRAFEQWANRDSLNYLETAQPSHPWLRSYLEEVKSDIRSQL